MIIAYMVNYIYFIVLTGPKGHCIIMVFIREL